MKKLTCTFHVFCISVILLCTVFVQGMESHTQKALIAEEYNQKNPNITFVNNLITLPSELLDGIMNFQYLSELSDEIMKTKMNIDNNVNAIEAPRLSDLLNKITSVLDIKSFEYGIKRYMMLSCTCKYFNEVLTPETIGNLHKHYNQDIKNNVWQRLMLNSTYHHSVVRRLPALLLICAGVTDTTMDYFLLNSIAIRDKVQQAAILFKYHHVNSNAEDEHGPIFFNAKTIEMVQLFINNGVDIHTENKYQTNVLWRILDDAYPSDLMIFYLAQGINPKKLRLFDKSCLLHAFAEPTFNYMWCYPKNIDVLKKGELLLNAMPDMVNMVNVFGKTPLDVAMETLKKIEEQAEEMEKEYGIRLSPSHDEFAKQLIALFRKYGGLTARELEQSESEEESDCIIF
jgi:hypothetical protein